MITKISKIFCAGVIGCGMAATLTSCEDFFNQESDDVLYAEEEHLNNHVDTIYSVTGILAKLQTLADRTILFGELRGDLVDLTSIANKDLHEIAEFNVTDDNEYNQPSDYYAVINNCNYFIAHADTALRSNRNQDIFMKEFCAVKAIRAWTYLQLGLVYGKVPFFTEPLLSKEAAEDAEKTTKTLEEICDFFIQDLTGLPIRYNTEFPGYRDIRNVESKLLFFPLSIVRGDLWLWKASFSGNKSDYLQAAREYYDYINQRNGENSAYTTTSTEYCMWEPGATEWRRPEGALFPISESITPQAELITLIAGDSIPAEGHYSELRNLFTSREDNDYKVSITPSARLFEISESQPNCVLANDGYSMYYAPKGLAEYRTGDLRLQDYYTKDWSIDDVTGQRIETQYIYKYSSQRNVHIYRRTMVYLRMAEALNMAGYPRMAFEILSQGLSNRVINNEVRPYYPTANDSITLNYFDFNDTRYQVCDEMDFIRDGLYADDDHNMMGIHARGCGWTPMDTTYVLPNDTIEIDDAKRAQLIKEQQVVVDDMILTESALEFALEGTRYYDVMRYALRQSNPGATMSKIIGARKGKDNPTTFDLSNKQNWFIKWKDKVGY